MYNIGICDDGKNTCAAIEEMILQYAERNKLKIDTQVWYAGEELCRYLEQGGHLDILFLDIELIQLTGIEVGDFIRNEMEDRGMQIVYISGHSAYAQELFKTQPMDFLVKPIAMQQIEDSLELAVKLIERNSGKFGFQNGRDYYFVSYENILYFESKGRKIKIVTVDAEKEFYGGIRELKKKLPKEFFAIHQSYVVNKTHVVRYTYETVEMDNDTILLISKAYRKQVRERLFKEIIMTDLILCVMTNLFRIYVISRFVHTFLQDGESGTCSNRMGHVLAYGIFFIVNTATYLAFHMMWVNIACNLLGIGLIVLTYTKSLKMILFVTGSVYIINMGCSMVAILPFVDYKDGVGFNQIYEVLDVFLVLVCEQVTEKIVNARQKTENIQNISLVLVPLCSMGMICAITYTGSSTETGIVIVSMGLVLINFFTFYLYNMLSNTLFHQYENEVLRQEIKGYANQVDVMMQGEEKVRALRHDMKHHMNELKILAVKGENRAIEEYIDDMQEFMINPNEIVASGNFEIDSVMNYMLYRAKEEQCNVNVKVQLPKTVAHSFDINVILGNLLENSIEAARQTEEKRLDIEIGLHQGFLRIQIQNSYDGKLEKDYGRLFTTKRTKEEHGIGLENVRKIVHKYNGIMEVCPDGDLFCVILLLYLNTEDQKFEFPIITWT